MTGVVTDTDVFEAERSRLLGLAYRITGSRSAADDLVQDAWIRWQRTDPVTIHRPAAWLTTVTSRLALDHLKAARHTRETYVGPWLPEPANPAPGPAEQAELAESLSLGFLAVLERLSPTERVVFLLAEIFSLPFDQIATVVDKSPEACRQVASRARKRVREGRPRFAPTDEVAWQVTGALLAAAQVGDIDGLVALLADGALLVSDGGADHHAARRPVVAARIRASSPTSSPGLPLTGSSRSARSTVNRGSWCARPAGPPTRRAVRLPRAASSASTSWSTPTSC